jgi:SAM-dependent methyltransferase
LQGTSASLSEIDLDQIKKRKNSIIAERGPWTSCIHLADGIYTYEEPQVPQLDTRLRKCLQVAADITGKPLEDLRVLDLACLEGQFGIEFALHGSRVLGTEGREANLAKARFVREVLSLDKLELALEDVRDLDSSRHGYFDVVLCLGIVYHLDAPDVMEFLKRVAGVCARVAIVDTHVSPTDEASFDWQGKTYWGRFFQEHSPDASLEVKEKAIWMSLDNPRAFVLTKPSLCNLLRHVGFSSVYEVMNPYEYHNPKWPLAPEGDRYAIWKDRTMLVAVKGTHQAVLSSPVTEALPERDHPERPEYLEGWALPGRPQAVRSWIASILPAPVKAALRQHLKRLGWI